MRAPLRKPFIFSPAHLAILGDEFLVAAGLHPETHHIERRHVAASLALDTSAKRRIAAALILDRIEAATLA